MKILKGIKILTQEEMRSIEGGSVSLPMSSSFREKSYCRTKANRILNAEQVSGMTQQQIAEEIFGHAVAYYSESTLRSIPGVGNSIADYLVNHADPIDIADGGDTLVRRAAFATIWAFMPASF